MAPSCSEFAAVDTHASGQGVGDAVALSNGFADEDHGWTFAKRSLDRERKQIEARGKDALVAEARIFDGKHRSRWWKPRGNERSRDVPCRRLAHIDAQGRAAV